VVNISDPLNPVSAGSYIPDDDLWNPFVLGDYLYVGNHELGGGELQILNVTDPSDITQVGLFDEGGSIFRVYVEDGIAYVADAQKGLRIVDVNDPQDPVRLRGFYDGGQAVNLAVLDDIVYVADRDGGLEIFQLRW
jgi:hypothetical protein